MDICKIKQKFLLHTGICYIEVPGSTDLGIEVLLKKKIIWLLLNVSVRIMLSMQQRVAFICISLFNKLWKATSLK